MCAYQQQSDCPLCKADADSRALTSVDVTSGSGDIVFSASVDTYVSVGVT